MKFDLLDLLNSYTILGVPSSGSNYIFTDGNMEITEVTNSTVTGRMHIQYKDSNGAVEDDLDGTFELERVSW